jgi:cyclophilin family peptidyl-prolyl cis-trans isomerase
MKKVIAGLLVLISGATGVWAEEVALLEFRVGRESGKRRVALEFLEGDAPGHVENFKKLARRGFYRGTTIHRSFPHQLMQMGDPLSRDPSRGTVGTGGPTFTLPPEIRARHEKGAVAAGRLPDKINPTRRSNGSQFFICLDAMPSYDGQYTVFGRVIYGMGVLDTLSQLPVDSNDNPVQKIEICSVRILDRARLPEEQTDAEIEAGRKPLRWWQRLGSILDGIF